MYIRYPAGRHRGGQENFILVHGHKIPVTDMTDMTLAATIDKVTSDSISVIERVANRLFGPHSGNKVTMVTMGRELGNWQVTLRKYGVEELELSTIELVH